MAPTAPLDTIAAGKVVYILRKPRFPVIWPVGTEVLSATSPAAFQRQVDRMDQRDVRPIDIVDATGRGWAFDAARMIVSPLTLKRRWAKVEVIRLFNESDTARRAGLVYPETYVPRRSVVRIIAEIAALIAHARRSARKHKDVSAESK